MDLNRLPLVKSRVAVVPAVAPFLAVLVGLIGQLTYGRAVVWTGDSFGFVHAGMMLAAGQDPAAHLEGRSLGYTLVTALALPLGGLRALVTIQSVAAAASLVAVLGLLRGLLRGRWVFCGVGLATVLMAYACDSFVVYAQTLNADSLFGSALTVSFVLLCATLQRRGEAAIVAMTAAFAFAYASYLLKPNALFVIPIYGLALVWTLWRGRWSVLKFGSFVSLAVLLAIICVSQAYQSKWKNPEINFGAGVLYAAHMDLINRDLDLSKPAQRDLHAIVDEVLQGPKWAILGLNADHCYYDARCQAAIRAAAGADNLKPGPWMMRRFLMAVVRHPFAYSHKVLKQSFYFLRHSNEVVDLVYPSAISDEEWDQILPYDHLVRFHRDELDRQVGSWVAERARFISFAGKHMVGLMRRTLPLTLLISLAAAGLGWRHRRLNVVQTAFLAAATVVLACVLSVAASMTFDIPRYAASFAVLTMLWWTLGWLWSTHWLIEQGLVRLETCTNGFDLHVRWPQSVSSSLLGVGRSRHGQVE